MNLNEVKLAIIGYITVRVFFAMQQVPLERLLLLNGRTLTDLIVWHKNRSTQGTGSAANDPAR